MNVLCVKRYNFTLFQKKKDPKICQVPIPYAAKQLLQELMAMHVVPRLILDVKKNSI